MAKDGPLTHGHRSAIKSRNFALMGIFGVLSGAWVAFRALAPKHGSYVVSDEERATVHGAISGQDPMSKRATVPKSIERT